MKTLLCLSALSLALTANAQAALDAAKVAAALSAATGENSFVAENGRITLQKSAHNNKEAGFEDCRQLAINSALLDVTMGGETAEYIAKGSHRILVSALSDDSIVRGMVGLRVTQENGGVAERTYTYLMQDGDNKHCDLKANEGVKPGTTKRSKIEKDYLQNVIPKLSADELAALKKKTETDTNEKLAGEAVKKLLHGECTETALNQALAGTAKIFATKSKQKGVAYLMLGLNDSGIVVEGSNAKGSIKTVMTDGQVTVKTLTTLQMVEGDKTCTLNSVQTAEAN